MGKKFDFEGAKKAGYSDQEIASYLGESHPDFDIQGAMQAGYSPEEIHGHLTKRSPLEKAGRIGMQAGLATAERALLPYEIAVAPLASKEAQEAELRKNIFEDIERLAEQKQTGVFDEQDQAQLDYLTDLIKHPEKIEPFVKTKDIGVRGLFEKATGIETKPEGIAEKAVGWTAFIKKPPNVKELAKLGINPKEIIKNVLPTGSEMFRGLGAGIGLEMAEQGEFGPLATLVAGVVGDLMGGGIAGIAKKGIEIAKAPKQFLAKAVATAAKDSKLELQKQIIQDFRNAGIQADIGTITGNNIIKSVQARLSASGLTGEPLENFRKQITKQFSDQYKNVADQLGELKFNTAFEAGEKVKEVGRTIRDTEKAQIAKIYEPSRKGLTDVDVVNPTPLANAIQKLEIQTKPGTLKSPEQKTILDVLEKIKSDIYDAGGNLKPMKMKDLLNTKTALHDIIDFEMQGGAKQSLKTVLQDIDKMIQSFGSTHPQFGKSLNEGNKRFIAHVKKFREGTMKNFLKESADPAQIMNKMGTVKGIKEIKRALSTTPEGEKLFNELKRMKLEEVVGDRMIDSTTHQLKYGTFAKILEDPKKASVVKELLTKEQYQLINRLQKASGRLQESAQKFLNTSQSATSAVDIGFYVKGLADLTSAFTGNFFPLIKTLGAYSAARLTSKLMSDTQFLRMVEDAVLSRESNKIWPKVIERFNQLVQEISPAATETLLEETKD